MTITTIQLERKTAEKLKSIRTYPRQTYNEIIEELIMMKSQLKNQYDEFLHKVQQDKMKELWDNKEDEIWDNV